VSARAAAVVLVGGLAGVAAWLAVSRQASAAAVVEDGGASGWGADLIAVVNDAGSALLGAVPESALDIALPLIYGAENFVYSATGDRMQTSAAGLAALLQHEGVGPGSMKGVRHVPYQDQGGRWTIGYGHLIKAGESFTEISEAEAVELRSADLRIAEDAVNSAVAVPLTQPMFDALVDFAFNVGVGAFRNSTLLAELNRGNYAAARDQFAAWNKITLADGSKVVSNGLVARRELEAALFVSGGGFA
jgi:lysozyme